MKNLNALNNQTLQQMVNELDEALYYTDLDLQEALIQLSYQMRQNAEINSTRQYWKDKYLRAERQLKEAGLHKKIERRISAVEEVKTEYIVKKNKKANKKAKKVSKHTKKSIKGNIHGSKHSGHKTKDEVLVGIMPNGDIYEFDTVNEAKDYVRKTFSKLKSSPLTNISRAARGTDFYAAHHTAYGIVWSYKAKELSL